MGLVSFSSATGIPCYLPPFGWSSDIRDLSQPRAASETVYPVTILDAERTRSHLPDMGTTCTGIVIVSRTTPCTCFQPSRLQTVPVNIPLFILAWWACPGSKVDIRKGSLRRWRWTLSRRVPNGTRTIPLTRPRIAPADIRRGGRDTDPTRRNQLSNRLVHTHSRLI